MSESLEQWIQAHGEGALWSAFSREALQDGEHLLKDQAVLDCSPGGQGFFARVQADRRHVYSVDCRIHPLPSPRPLTTHCGCPEGGACAHAVAAVLFYLGRRTTEGASSTNPAVHQWLSELQSARDAAPSSRREAVVYLLEDDGNGGVLVTPRRGRIKRSGGYGRLNPFQGLRRAPAELLTADDRRLLRLLPEAGSAIAPEDLLFLLEAMARTGRAHWQTPDTPPLTADGPAAGGFRWQVRNDGSQQLRPAADDEHKLSFAGQPPVWLEPSSGRFGPLDTGLATPLVERALAAPVIEAGDVEATARALSQQNLPLPCPEAPRRRRFDDIRPVPRLRLTRLADPGRSSRVDAGEPIAEFSFDYAGHTVSAGDPKKSLAVYHGGAICEYRRHPRDESRARERLEAAGLVPAGCMAEDRFAPAHTGDWRRFIASAVPALQDEGWHVHTESCFPWRLAEAALWEADVRRESQRPGWFSLDVAVEVDGERHALLPLLLALIRDNPEAMSPRHLDAIDPAASLLIDLGDGRLVPVPASRLVPLLRGLTELYDPALRLDHGRLPMPLGRAGVLDQLEAAEPAALHWQGDGELRRLGREIAAIDSAADAPTPTGLRGELRPYQRQGLAWLQHLGRLGLGGVLADDMGLGKTLQVLAHLLLDKEADRCRGPSLVVVPTSLMFNWVREAARFAPDLRVLGWHGPDRHQQNPRFDDHDLVLTTYSLLVRDVERLHNQSWHLLVLDEAQAVKNPRAQAARAVRTLEAHQRLSLTGTPLENHLGELWSQFDFVAPGLLGNASVFKRLYRRPIEQDGDEGRLATLRERVAPFLLRRTKQAIAADLPPKTEMSLYAELVGGQRTLYEQLRLGQHARVRQALAEQTGARARLLVLEALLKLREACCDPRLVDNAPADAHESAKLDLLMELVDDLMQAGRRVLVFSQFTRMLRLIETALAERGHCWAKLTGETRDREAQVNRFQSGEVPLFLVSLKAGGTGLNLTAADTVIHYDPWWNPAVTRQATDRAHRIGQDQPVFVYHLLTRDTVEDRIMALQRDKAELGERLLGDGAAPGVTPLDPDAVSRLFAPLDDAGGDGA